MKKILLELKDPRYFQILFLASFLSYGILFLGWKSDYLQYLAVISTALITQLAFAWFTAKPLSSVKSALITSLGLSMLLKASSPWYFALAAFLAIASKFLIRYKGKHLFNPANIGIVLCLLFTNQVWVSPGQWGSGTLLVFFIGIAGITVVTRVNRLDTAITFILTLFALQYARFILHLHWDLPVLLHKFSSGTLLLFTFFMITDPMTIPNHPKARIPWAMLVAILTFVLSNWFFVYAAAIWALFAVTPITLLLDNFYRAPKYEWTEKIVTPNIQKATL